MQLFVGFLKSLCFGCFLNISCLLYSKHLVLVSFSSFCYMFSSCLNLLLSLLKEWALSCARTSCSIQSVAVRYLCWPIVVPLPFLLSFWRYKVCQHQLLDAAFYYMLIAQSSYSRHSPIYDIKLCFTKGITKVFITSMQFADLSSVFRIAFSLVTLFPYLFFYWCVLNSITFINAKIFVLLPA